MSNLIVGFIILVILGSAGAKLYIEKKNGAKCIGCPHGGRTSTKNKSCCDETTTIQLKS